MREIASLLIKNHVIQELHLNDDSKNVIDSLQNYKHLLLAMTQNKSITKLDYDVSPHLQRNSTTKMKEALLDRDAIARLENQLWLNRQIKQLLWPI